MRYRAYSPGSVTLFFEPLVHGDLHLSGSRGVGVCVSPGAITEITEGRGIYLNGREIDGPIQREVAKRYGFDGKISTTTVLPVSQGFGMSGAISLSSSLALASKFSRTYLYAARVAHEVEVKSGTGLGDVASQFEGGFTIRLREGIQPFGVVDRLPYRGKIKLVVFEGELETRDILGDEGEMRRIVALGRESMEKFTRDMNVESAIKIGRKFSFSLGLMDDPLEKFLKRCQRATQALFGNSAIVFGDCRIPHEGVEYDVSIGSRAAILD